MAEKYPSDAKFNAPLKKTEPKSQLPKKSVKSASRDLSRNKKVKSKPRKSQDLSNRKDFVTIDIDAHRLTVREQKKRVEDRKSKNQILGQLEAYNQTMPAHSRISPEVTGQLLKERVRTSTNIFEFDVAMARSDLILKESKNLLNDAPTRKASAVNFTQATATDSPDFDLNSSGVGESFERSGRLSKSDESLTNSIDDRFAKLLHLKPKLKENYSPRHQYAADGSILVPESRHKIFPVLPQEYLTQLRATDSLGVSNGHTQYHKEKARATGSFHRGTLCSPAQSYPYLDPHPTDCKLLRLRDDFTSTDLDKVLWFSTQKDLSQLTELETQILKSATVDHEVDMDPHLASTRIRTMNHVNELKSALYQLRNEVEDREFSKAYKSNTPMRISSIKRICADLAKCYLGATVSPENLREDLKASRQPTSSHIYPESEGELEERSPLVNTESEELILNLRNASKLSSDQRQTLRRLKRGNPNKQLIVLKPPGYANEFPRESRMDLDQIAIPPMYIERDSVKTTSSPMAHTYPAANDQEAGADLPITQSEHSCARKKIREHLKRLEKYEH